MMHRQLGRMDRSASNAMLKLAETVSGTNPNLSLAASNPPASPQFDNISSTSSPNERIRSVLQFEDCFWGNGEDPTVGVKTLYDLISKHLNEVEEMIVAVKQRIAIEEGYAMRMADFAKVLQTFTLASGFIGASTHTGMGFGNAVPYGGIGGLGSASAWGGQGIDYSSSASSPTTVEASAQHSFARRGSGTLSQGATDSAGQDGNTDSASPPSGGLYHSLEKPGGGATVEDGSSLFPVVRNWGKILMDMTSCNRRHADTLLLAVLTPLQAFVSQHRRVMEKKKAEVDSHHRTVTKLYSEISQKRSSYVSKNRSHAALPSTTLDEIFTRSQKESEAAKQDYQQAITAAEHSRSALEFHITDFLLWAQETEYYRLKVAREAFLALESAQLFTVEAHTRLWTVDVDPEHAHASGGGSSYTASSTTSSDENAVPALRLITPSPSHGIENIAMRFTNRVKAFPPFVFDPYVPPSTDSPTSASIPSPRQAFGIPLDDLAKATGDPIPAVVRKCVASLIESKTKQRLRSGIDAWIMPNPDLPSVHFMRLEFNSSLAGQRVGSTRLARETPAVVAGVLKLFLVEMPTSLCHYEVYDVLKIIYAADNIQEGEEETMIRIKSVASLLSTLSAAHYETLKIFAGLMHETVRGIDPTDKRLRRLAYSISPCILRPKRETSETLADEHPYLLTMDLLLHFPDLFGGALPASYFEAPPTPPASPEPDDDVEMDDGVAPRGFGRLKASSSLNLKAESGDLVKGAWRGLVKSVSNLNLRGAAPPASTVSPVSPAGGSLPQNDASGWFSWGRSPSTQSTPKPPTKSSTTMEEEMVMHESDFDLDHEVDVGGEDGDVHACHWAGCKAILPSPESLIEHLRGVHMRVYVGGVVVAEGGGMERRSSVGSSKRSSAAVLPVLEMEEEEGEVRGMEVVVEEEEGVEGMEKVEGEEGVEKVEGEEKGVEAKEE